MKIPFDDSLMKRHLDKHPNRIRESRIRKATVICFIVQRGHIVAVGYNRRMNLAPDGRLSKCAEEDALKKAGRRATGATVYTIRLKKDDTYGLAYPCVRCRRALRKSAVGVVFYSKDDGSIGRTTDTAL